MPLHLLGKKSWNVYNPENIAKVARDEEAAHAEEAAAERRSRTEHANNRLKLLRGDEEGVDTGEREARIQDQPRRLSSYHKKRRLAGEDDTDREIRLARIDRESQGHGTSLFQDGAPRDRAGHSEPFPKEQSSTPRDENSKNTEFEQMSNMRFCDATGRKQGHGQPWYSTDADVSQMGKDVWGNEDPRRKEREQKRLNSNDPLLAMKHAVKKLRETEQQRREWKQQREQDLSGIEHLARREKRHKRRRHDDLDSIEDFKLDADDQEKSSRALPKRRRSEHVRDRAVEKRSSHQSHRHRSSNIR